MSKDILRVNLRKEVDYSYDIVFGEEMFVDVANYCSGCGYSRYAVVTDDNVAEIYADGLCSAFEKESLKTNVFSFEAGEESKNLETVGKLSNSLGNFGYDRDSCVLALGGGVVGDVSGFLASMYMRGIDYVQIPTTTLAQADSSVGGKTGVNSSVGKNMLGAFKQPRRVFVDVSTLDSLPERHYRGGLSESVKHGIIQDEEFFVYLLENVDRILQRDSGVLLNVARSNCRIKSSVVESDEKETGFRRILNFGHTIGHAVEKLSNYELSHGEAVSVGMMVEGRISRKLGGLTEDELRRQEELLFRMYLPLRIPEDISNDDILDVASRDKKGARGNARYVVPSCFGEIEDFDGEYATTVSEDIVVEALSETR